MKTKILMSVLAIGLAIALIGGATMAWFTDDAEVPAAEFTAGTVKISADEEIGYAPVEGKSFKNVNPGDCGKVTWRIYNIGTKAIELRVKLSELWEGYLSTENFFYAPEKNSGWVMRSEINEDTEKEEIWLYYIGGPVRGTFDYINEDPEGFEPAWVVLPLIVAFDGPTTVNDYQDKWFELSGDVEAVQASNGAPIAVWGGFWEGLKDENYSPDPESLAGQYLAYMEEVKCYKGGDEEPEPETHSVTAIIVQDDAYGSVDGEGDYAAGAEVQLTATAKEGHKFVCWELPEELELIEGSVDVQTIKFIMPGKDVQVTAVFEEIQQVAKYNLELERYVRKPKKGGYKYESSNKCGTLSGGGNDKEVGQQVTLRAYPKKDYKFVGWYISNEFKSDQELSTKETYIYTNNSAEDGVTVTLYGLFEKDD